MYLSRDKENNLDVGYWRKANQIHNWFVENVQGGVDDCGHYPVTIAQLEKLLGVVNKVLASCEMVEGQVNNGYRFEGEKKIPIMVEGKYVKNPDLARELLPTTEGFFFGGIDYDENYVADLTETKEIVEKALKEGGAYYYHSSW